MPLHEFPSAEILVAGPPCPPFSSLGVRQGLLDRRAGVFWKVVDVISELAVRKDCPLRCFILENVAVIARRPNGTGQSPLCAILGELATRLPQSWTLQHLLMDTQSYGLPHRRPRIYIVGRNKLFFPRWPAPAPPQFRREISISDIIDFTDNAERDDYTETQRQNLGSWKAVYDSSMKNTRCVGRVAFVDVSGRTNSRTVLWNAKKTFQDNICECLTANGPALHVFALGEGTGHLSLDRPLRPQERGLLQGFPAAITTLAANIHSEIVCKRIFGNAMSVPVIGSLIARELTAMLRHCNMSARAELFVVAPQPHAAGEPAAPRSARTCSDAAPTRTVVVPAAQQLTSASGADSPAAGPEAIEEEEANSPSWPSHSPSPQGQAHDQPDIDERAFASVAAWGASISGHWKARRSGRAPQPSGRAFPAPASSAELGRLPKRARPDCIIHCADVAPIRCQDIEGNVPNPQPDPQPAQAASPMAPQQPVALSRPEPRLCEEEPEIDIIRARTTNTRGRRTRK